MYQIGRMVRRLERSRGSCEDVDLWKGGTETACVPFSGIYLLFSRLAGILVEGLMGFVSRVAKGCTGATFVRAGSLTKGSRHHWTYGLVVYIVLVKSRDSM